MLKSIPLVVQRRWDYQRRGHARTIEICKEKCIVFTAANFVM